MDILEKQKAIVEVSEIETSQKQDRRLGATQDTATEKFLTIVENGYQVSQIGQLHTEFEAFFYVLWHSIKSTRQVQPLEIVM